MFHSLRGTLLHTEPGVAVVDCGGVGFLCNVSLYTLSALPRRGDEVMLFTHMAVSESAITLYGFIDGAELESFRKLTTVKGVGAKVALSILSELSPSQLALAISAGDAKAVAKGQGVGPKLAQRILLELKDQFGFTTDAGFTVAPDTLAEGASSRSEAVSALVALGYSQSEAAVAVAKCPEDWSPEAMIREALRGLAAKL